VEKEMAELTGGKAALAVEAEKKRAEYKEKLELLASKVP
jgi:hypothetical protein